LWALIRFIAIKKLDTRKSYRIKLTLLLPFIGRIILSGFISYIKELGQNILKEEGPEVGEGLPRNLFSINFHFYTYCWIGLKDFLFSRLFPGFEEGIRRLFLFLTRD